MVELDVDVDVAGAIEVVVDGSAKVVEVCVDVVVVGSERVGGGVAVEVARADGATPAKIKIATAVVTTACLACSRG